MTLDHEAIYKAYAGTVVSISDDNGAFDKDGNKVTLDNAKVTAARKVLDDEAAAVKYQFDRAEAFTSIGDQLDMQYWDAVNGTSTWKDHVAAVKSKYPKP